MRNLVFKSFLLVLMISVLFSTHAFADTLQVVENQVTFTELNETEPNLGNDGTGDLVVYTKRELLGDGFFDQGDIYYQRLDATGAPDGAPVQVTSDLTDDMLNDVSGDHIVFTSYDNTVAMTGTIMLYKISTGVLLPLGDSLVIQEPRIHGDLLVWVQGAIGSSEVMMYDLNDLGTATAPLPLTGPIPPCSNVDIGDRYVVWVEKKTDGNYDIGAYDLIDQVRIRISETPTVDERHPSTSGDWIVWESRDHGAANKRIEAVNLTTPDYRVIVDDGSVNARPDVNGDLITYESDTEGNKDIFLYRISTEETFAVTTSLDDEYLNNVFGDLVAYVNYHEDALTAGVYDEDVWVAALTFVPPDPCEGLGGDTDGDGVCDADDNCPDDANADQADADEDGIGDVCDDDDNLPPLADPNGSYSADEGSPVTFDGTGSSDPDADVLTYDWTFGDSTSGLDIGPTPVHTYDDNGSYDVCLTVTDTGGLFDEQCTTANISNVAPSVGPITAPIDPVQVDTAISTSADFTDPGILDTHTAVWDWGDGTTSDGAVNETDGSGTATGSHSYSAAGVYTVTLTVTDKDGDSGTSTYQFIVVYDPTGGFVTGGGWINSPEGAYVPDSALAGKANFGFVSKYKKGATTPTGNTEFQFKAGDLNFHSDSYEWLVIAGHKAKYKGTGTINGSGNYGFMLSAIDEKLTPSTDVDLFRIKIWDKDAGDAVIYDNQLGAADDADPTTALGGGSIVIHKAKK
jgi:PKD repeat protein